MLTNWRQQLTLGLGAASDECVMGALRAVFLLSTIRQTAEVNVVVTHGHLEHCMRII